MCDYCQGEGCYCGRTGEPQCQSEVTETKCARCNCDPQPWWFDVDIPGDGAVSDMLGDINSDDKFFPASKEKVLRTAGDFHADVGWLSRNLSGQSYSGTGEIVSDLTRNSLPIKWNRKPTEIFWRYAAGSIPINRTLSVSEDQRVVMVSKKGKVCDEFSKGEYLISEANCPLLLAQSRKSLPGRNQLVLNGSPVFFSPSMEFELDISTNGKTKALRNIMANGNARVRISSPKLSIEAIGSMNYFNLDSTLQALKKFCDGTLKNEMSMHEFEELSENRSILEASLSKGLMSIGLEPIRLSLTYVGERGPGMFVSGSNPMSDPRMIEKMKQMAETFRAMRPPVSSIPSRPAPTSPSSSAPDLTVLCPTCNAPNPSTSKFCGDCGKPLNLKKTCPKCGQKSEAGLKFCGNCGTRLD